MSLVFSQRRRHIVKIPSVLLIMHWLRIFVFCTHDSKPWLISKYELGYTEISDKIYDISCFFDTAGLRTWNSEAQCWHFNYFMPVYSQMKFILVFTIVSRKDHDEDIKSAKMHNFTHLGMILSCTSCFRVSCVFLAALH